MTICCGWCWRTPRTSNGCTASISPGCRTWRGFIRASPCARCKNRVNCRCVESFKGSSSGFQDQRECHFDLVFHPFGALPVALPDAEFQTLEFGGPLDPGLSGRGNELKIDRHVLCDAVQGQCAYGAVSLGGLRKASRDVVSRRKMRDVEDVRTAHRLVAILVHGIERIQIDLHVEARTRQRVGREIDGGREFSEGALELGARLHSDELETAGARIRRIAGRRTRGAGGGRRGEDCDHKGDSSHHERFSDFVKGSMRKNTSSLFQK